jgi:adenylate cyclase
MSLPVAGNTPVVTPLLIVFGDFTGYTKFADALAPDALFRLFSAYAVFAAARIEAAGGQLVKVIGDAMLVTFPEDKASAGILRMLALKAESEEWMRSRGFHTTMVLKAHFGEVACGPFGSDGRFDVYGQTVNTTARLDSNGFALSEQAFRLLAPEAQRAFKKHPLRETYIPASESHP